MGIFDGVNELIGKRVWFLEACNGGHSVCSGTIREVVSSVSCTSACVSVGGEERVFWPYELFENEHGAQKALLQTKRVRKWMKSQLSLVEGDPVAETSFYGDFI